MRKLIMMALIALTAISCKKEIIGTGPVITETRAVTNFNAIDLRMNGNVYFTESPVFKVEITAKESIHRLLQTQVTNGKLVIQYRDLKTYDSDESISIRVYCPTISHLELHSSGSIFSTSDIYSTELSLETSGSGSIQLQSIFVEQLVTESLVSGKISSTGGTALNASTKTDASGKIDMSSVIVRKAKARINGSGDIRLNVTDELDARIYGSGSVYYKGDPWIFSELPGTGDLIHF